MVRHVTLASYGILFLITSITEVLQTILLYFKILGFWVIRCLWKIVRAVSQLVFVAHLHTYIRMRFRELFSM